jgi:hypothetical protein
MSEAEDKGQEIEEAFNELIQKCADNKGFICIVDKQNTDFILRITEPIRIRVYEGYKGVQDEEK